MDFARLTYRPLALFAMVLVIALGDHGTSTQAALYPRDQRHPMTTPDYARYSGAGVLYCRDGEDVPRKAAAAWLIVRNDLVLMNAHNFRDRAGMPTRQLGDCHFQIGGRNYSFRAGSLLLGTDGGPLHITDDWALAKLAGPVDAGIVPQPIPKPTDLRTGTETMPVVMVSPAGHANYRGVSSIETCAIREIDPPSEGGIRRARHDCNDGFGGSGSGLFDEAGRLIAMQSASLDMNRRMDFDVASHYGSALLIEGMLLRTLQKQ